MNLRWTPKSQDDLEIIHKVIKKNFDVHKANEVILKIIDTTETLLSKNPLAGKILESNPLFSFLVIEGNTVFYAKNEKDDHLYIVYVQARKSLKDDSRFDL